MNLSPYSHGLRNKLTRSKQMSQMLLFN